MGYVQISSRKIGMEITDNDWEVYNELIPQIQEVFCSRFLELIKAKIEDKQSPPSELYREVVLLASKSDREHMVSFNPSPRDGAIMNVVSWRMQKIITDEQMSLFSEKTRLAVEEEAKAQEDK